MENLTNKIFEIFDKLYDAKLKDEKERDLVIIPIVLSAKIAGKEALKEAGEKAAKKLVEEETAKVAEKEGLKVAEKEAAKVAEKEGLKVAEKEGLKVAEKEAVKIAEKEALKVTEKEAVKIAEKEALKIAEKEALKVAEKEGVKIVAKSASKVATGTAVKYASKALPVVGPLTVGIGFGIYRLCKGEYLKAAAEVGSGALGAVPVVGTGLSIAADTAIAAWDISDVYHDTKEQSRQGTNLQEAIIDVEEAIEEGTFSKRSFFNEVFDKMYEKLKSSSDNEYVAAYIFKFVHEVFKRELEFEMHEIVEKMKDEGFTKEQRKKFQAMQRKAEE